MNQNPTEIVSSRILNFPNTMVYRAFSDPQHLKNWWGPEGFTNTIHEFDLQPGGKWTLTMHGPEKGNYENASIFDMVRPSELVRWTRISKPLFTMSVTFQALDGSKTEISFRMQFDSPEECDKVRRFAVPKNEENFDRLERELKNMAEVR
jgi:uncharacterized protein YndB with AHSA1/START domain